MTKKELIAQVDLWIDEWINLFPRGVRSGGKLVRSDKKECAKKMKQFMKDYDYDKDTIFKSTKRYLEERENEDFAFVRCATYFIHRKDVGSTLAEECRDFIENSETYERSESNYFG